MPRAFLTPVSSMSLSQSYLLFFSSEYELHEWRENIERLKNNSLQPFPLSPDETHSIINSYILQHPTTNLPLYSPMEEGEEAALRGILSLSINSVSGFTKPHHIYCCFEVDCHGYFEKKAQTTVLHEDRFPTWEEEIDLQLDGAHWLRVLLWEQHDYRITSEQQDRSEGDRLLGTSQIPLDPKNLLPKEWKALTIDLNGHQLSCTVSYLQQNLSQLDELSGAPRGIFGVPISIVTYRDHSRIPLLVRHCAEDVERRGLKEVGIYRVSGIATDVQVLKAAFDSNVKEAVTKLKDNDIHVVAGTLKLYLRELPEPLLTHELIPSFVSAAAQEDPAEKDNQMVSLLHQLPEANLNTFIYMMKHLKTSRLSITFCPGRGSLSSSGS
ncbi:active breakpoint cluster region-related protein-like [Stegostoma tigrinum]|uniref:active breakpoint cluster region-related protein-like n=1 Tax=Stegostoma tigrinum TaxID=3053191 RepID=UPI002870797D|nr:active breakpoint cluster region-related protein-like [Stegostoma tigrinum]